MIKMILMLMCIGILAYLFPKIFIAAVILTAVIFIGIVIIALYLVLRGTIAE